MSSTIWRSNVERLITFSTSAVAVCCSSAALQVCSSCLYLVKQSYILDCNYSLVREGLQKLDLLLGKERRFRARNSDRSNGNAVAQQGDSGEAAVVHKLCKSTKFVLSVGLDIRNLFNSGAENSSTSGAATVRYCWPETALCLELFWGEPVMGGKVHQHAIETKNVAKLRVARCAPLDPRSYRRLAERRFAIARLCEARRQSLLAAEEPLQIAKHTRARGMYPPRPRLRRAWER